MRRWQRASICAGTADLELTNLAADGKVPAGVQYVVGGRSSTCGPRGRRTRTTSRRERARPDESIGQQLFRNLERRVTSEVDEALDRDTESRYLQNFNIDVQVEITKVADNTKVVNLERRSYEMAEAEASATADLQKTAVADAVREALALTLQKYPL